MEDEPEYQTLRDRIVAKLDNVANPTVALWALGELAVQLVERHGPMADDYLDVGALVCGACSDPEEGRWTMYPCAELRWIARSVGVEIED